MERIMNLLDGKKMYLGSIAAGLLGIFWSLGYVDDKAAQVIASIIAAWTGVAFRSALPKKSKKS